MGEWALPAGRGDHVFDGAPRGAGRAPAGGPLAARRDLAQLPGPLPRDQRPPQADAPGIAASSTRCRPARPATAATRPAPRRPVERPLLARPVRRDLPAGPPPGEPREPDRRRGPRARRRRRRDRRSSCRPRPRRSAGDPARERRRDRRRSSPTRAPGSAAGTSGAARLALAAVLRRRPEAYHEKVRRLDATAAARRTSGGAWRPATRTTTAPASIHDIVMTKQSGLVRASSATTPTSGDPACSGSSRPTSPPTRSRSASTICGDFASGAWTVRELAADGAVAGPGRARPDRRPRDPRPGGEDDPDRRRPARADPDRRSRR